MDEQELNEKFKNVFCLQKETYWVPDAAGKYSKPTEVVHSKFNMEGILDLVRAKVCDSLRKIIKLDFGFKNSRPSHLIFNEPENQTLEIVQSTLKSLFYNDVGTCLLKIGPSQFDQIFQYPLSNFTREIFNENYKVIVEQFLIKEMLNTNVDEFLQHFALLTSDQRRCIGRKFRDFKIEFVLHKLNKFCPPCKNTLVVYNKGVENVLMEEDSNFKDCVVNFCSQKRLKFFNQYFFIFGYHYRDSIFVFSLTATDGLNSFKSRKFDNVARRCSDVAMTSSSGKYLWSVSNDYLTTFEVGLNARVKIFNNKFKVVRKFCYDLRNEHCSTIKFDVLNACNRKFVVVRDCPTELTLYDFGVRFITKSGEFYKSDDGRYFVMTTENIWQVVIDIFKKPKSLRQKNIINDGGNMLEVCCNVFRPVKYNFYNNDFKSDTGINKHYFYHVKIVKIGSSNDFCDKAFKNHLPPIYPINTEFAVFKRLTQAVVVYKSVDNQILDYFDAHGNLVDAPDLAEILNFDEFGLGLVEGNITKNPNCGPLKIFNYCDNHFNTNYGRVSADGCAVPNDSSKHSSDKNVYVFYERHLVYVTSEFVYVFFIQNNQKLELIDKFICGDFGFDVDTAEIIKCCCNNYWLYFTRNCYFKYKYE